MSMDAILTDRHAVMKTLSRSAAVLAAVLIFIPVSGACRHKDLLYSEFVSSGAASSILPAEDWFPYPDYADRDAWERLFGDAARDAVVRAGEYLGYVWQNVPLTAYLAFERTGDRRQMEVPYNENRAALNALVLGELAEGKGRFTDQILDGIWTAVTMPSWIYSAHGASQPGGRSLPDARYQIIDLASAGYGALVAVTYHFFKDIFMQVNPYICHEIERSLEEKIKGPYLDASVRGSNWWMALDGEDAGPVFVNNWNPWCNSNVLLTFLLTEKDPDRLREAVELSVRSVDKFLGYVKGDGACEEGPSYWSHAFGKLFDYLEILQYATGGRMSVFGEPLLKDMCEYIHRSYIGEGFVVNFADAPPVLEADNTLIYRSGKACGSKEAEDFALSLLYRPQQGRFVHPGITPGNDVWRSLGSVACHVEMSCAADSLNALLDTVPLPGLPALLQKTPSDVSWYPETGLCLMRNGGGWFCGAKAGSNGESHNHNDVGSFILYIDSVPVFVDAGTGTYTRRTFSHERYTIWNMQSDWHNLPAINGTSQIAGAEFMAREVVCDTSRRFFSADICGAYSGAASCRSWVRSYSLEDDGLVIKDRYALEKRVMPDVTAFLVQGMVFLPGEEYIPSSEGVPAKAVREGTVLTKSDLLMKRTVRPGTVAVSNRGLTVEMSFPPFLTPSVETRELSDPELRSSWGPSLRRILFKTRQDAPCRTSCTYIVRRLRTE